MNSAAQSAAKSYQEILRFGSPQTGWQRIGAPRGADQCRICGRELRLIPCPCQARLHKRWTEHYANHQYQSVICFAEHAVPGFFARCAPCALEHRLRAATLLAFPSETGSRHRMRKKRAQMMVAGRQRIIGTLEGCRSLSELAHLLSAAATRRLVRLCPSQTRSMAVMGISKTPQICDGLENRAPGKKKLIFPPKWI